MNDLLPLPYTEEALALIIKKVDQVQHLLDRKILIENPSTYVSFTHSTISETEFITEVAKATGCALLLDVNNIYVSAVNQQLNPQEYLQSIPEHLVEEIHLAGHTIKQFANHTLLIDTHNQLICNDVWDLYSETLKHLGNKPTLIEWDSDLPELAVLISEADYAQSIMDENYAQVA